QGCGKEIPGNQQCQREDLQSKRTVRIDNSQFTIDNFRASREQSRIYSDFAEAQPKIEANASIHN
ncbi:MAG: hypothetical protein J5682_05885, partial [Prevotella sp.]|nr:hypothetical protein [Prevotella sp.]